MPDRQAPVISEHGRPKGVPGSADRLIRQGSTAHGHPLPRNADVPNETLTYTGSDEGLTQGIRMSSEKRRDGCGGNGDLRGGLGVATRVQSTRPRPRRVLEGRDDGDVLRHS
jgi:hypothetical protein